MIRTSYSLTLFYVADGQDASIGGDLSKLSAAVGCCRKNMRHIGDDNDKNCKVVQDVGKQLDNIVRVLSENSAATRDIVQELLNKVDATVAAGDAATVKAFVDDVNQAVSDASREGKKEREAVAALRDNLGVYRMLFCNALGNILDERVPWWTEERIARRQKLVAEEIAAGGAPDKDTAVTTSANVKVEDAQAVDIWGAKAAVAAEETPVSVQEAATDTEDLSIEKMERDEVLDGYVITRRWWPEPMGDEAKAIAVQYLSEPIEAKRSGMTSRHVDREYNLCFRAAHRAVLKASVTKAATAAGTGDATATPETDLQFHHELLWRIGGYEPSRGERVAGHSAYFLTGPGVLFNLALINYGLQFLMKRRYKPVAPPYFMDGGIMAQTAQLSTFDEDLYRLDDRGVSESEAPGAQRSGHGRYLIATSEQPISAYHLGETIEAGALPYHYAGVSTCFRKEAGSHGRDVWGIFRVHQFEKVEQFIVCEQDESPQHLDEMVQTSEAFYQTLGLPYRVICLPADDMNNAAAIKFDIEIYFPKYDEFKELVSCSNCTDYQSRGLNVRHDIRRGQLQLDPSLKGKALEKERKEKTRPRFVHMLNGTLCATGRTICALLENYQGTRTTADGTLEEGVFVPEVLQPFMGGIEFFPFVRAARNAGSTAERKKAKKQSKKATK